MELPGKRHINTAGITDSLTSGARGTIAYGDQKGCSAGSRQSWGQIPFPITCFWSPLGYRQALVCFWPPSHKLHESCIWPGFSRRSRVTSSWKIFPSRGWCGQGDPSRCPPGGKSTSTSGGTVSPNVPLLLPIPQHSSGPQVAPLRRH